MLDYPPKILIAFGETISGNTEIFNWLLKNGYPELAALKQRHPWQRSLWLAHEKRLSSTGCAGWSY